MTLKYFTYQNDKYKMLLNKLLDRIEGNAYPSTVLLEVLVGVTSLETNLLISTNK